MKRFFQPVQKDVSFKKPTLSSSSSSSPSSANDAETKAPPVEDDDEKTQKKEPTKFLTWNANSFLLRVKNNWPEFTKFIDSIDPDVIAIQEVRMPAAGAKGASKNPRELKDDNNSSREEKLIITRALSGPTFRKYDVWWSLSDSKYAGTALFIKKCFPPKKHEPDGRVIIAEFESFRIMNTYVPNNGWKDEETSFQRRRKWDKRIKEFILRSMDKPLIWCGDLNVSHEEIDVSHPDFFQSAKLNGYIPPNKEDCGQPGFTLSERKRFGSILKEGSLIDAYRFLHKDKDMERGFSWSGHPIGKYRGKRMRIDYHLVSEKLKDKIVKCEMHGHGIELEGFYGSDHCPVSLELAEPSLDAEKLNTN
ncbi:Endonuclease/exonuclease/phosphatase [Cynara cardunculus var. scolymus]|uniref:DNA-(apurinic or apyrimidinic site) endonuclease n=1 Tax=Cynara cardunculus var. scolymus TaxID=59895 RepID=A0A103YBX1_CYNCS|nr:Endonuclease/exonuclease/phosphatase [Cynara cardunculus var. scolymus]